MQLALQTANQDCWLCRINGLSKIATSGLFLLAVLFIKTQSILQVIWLLAWHVGLLVFALKLQPALKGYFLRSAFMFFILVLPLPFRSLVENDWALVQFAGLSVFYSGMLRFMGTFLKAMILLIVSLTLIAATPFSEILRAFKKLKMPDWALSILMYVFRLIFLMEEEGLRMKRAMQARSGKISLKRKLQILVQFSVVYLARLMGRSERTYWAMVSRGFRGKIVLAQESSFRKSDWFFLLTPLAFGIGVFL